MAHNLEVIDNNEPLKIFGWPLFLPVYGLLFLRYGYRRHPFEVAATRRAAALRR